jgi:3',5'-cyclic AMP phosphodiesterase CpdA
MLHHHLLPVPGTGRERNVVYDAGDVLEVLQRCRVNLVLSGHKHVPYAWRLEDIFVVNTGTTCSLRLRGNIKPCYTIITVEEHEVKVTRKYPFHGSETILEFSPSTLHYVKYVNGPS